MKLEEIQSRWKKDCKIKSDNISDEILNISKLHHSYFDILLKEKKTLNKLNKSLTILKKYRREHYLGILSDDVRNSFGWKPFQKKITKQESTIYLDSDPVLHKTKSRIEDQEIKVEYLYSILSMINNRGYHLKDFIEWIKFSQGR